MSLLNINVKPKICFAIFSSPSAIRTGKVTDASRLLHQSGSKSANDVEKPHSQSAMYIEYE